MAGLSNGIEVAITRLFVCRDIGNLECFYGFGFGSRLVGLGRVTCLSCRLTTVYINIRCRAELLRVNTPIPIHTCWKPVLTRRQIRPSWLRSCLKYAFQCVDNGTRVSVYVRLPSHPVAFLLLAAALLHPHTTSIIHTCMHQRLCALCMMSHTPNTHPHPFYLIWYCWNGECACVCVVCADKPHNRHCSKTLLQLG